MDQRSLSILLVDDSHAVQAVVRHLLEGQGHRVDVASSGSEALNAMEREDYDAVLMDICMPEMDGLETMRRLCQSSSASCRPPVIALTSATSPEIRERCFLLGMEEFLAKPVRGSVLIEVVGRLASRGRAARERQEEALTALSPDRIMAPEDFPVRQIMTQVVVDGMLGDLRIWSDEEWSHMTEERRPKAVTYCQGLGWIGVIPRIGLN